MNSDSDAEFEQMLAEADEPKQEPAPAPVDPPPLDENATPVTL